MKKKEELYARKKLGEHAASITDRMIEIRKLKGMTRKEFAEKCGVGIRTVCYWDGYQRAIKSGYLPAIFRALDVSPNEFFGVADKDPHAEWNKLQTDLLKVRSEARAIVGAIDIKLACLKDGMREQAAK